MAISSFNIASATHEQLRMIARNGTEQDVAAIMALHSDSESALHEIYMGAVGQNLLAAGRALIAHEQNPLAAGGTKATLIRELVKYGTPQDATDATKKYMGNNNMLHQIYMGATGERLVAAGRAMVAHDLDPRANSNEKRTIVCEYLKEATPQDAAAAVKKYIGNPDMLHQIYMGTTGERLLAAGRALISHDPSPHDVLPIKKTMIREFVKGGTPQDAADATRKYIDNNEMLHEIYMGTTGEKLQAAGRALIMHETKPKMTMQAKKSLIKDFVKNGTAEDKSDAVRRYAEDPNMIGVILQVMNKSAVDAALDLGPLPPPAPPEVKVEELTLDESVAVNRPRIKIPKKPERKDPSI